MGETSAETAARFLALRRSKVHRTKAHRLSDRCVIDAIIDPRHSDAAIERAINALLDREDRAKSIGDRCTITARIASGFTGAAVERAINLALDAIEAADARDTAALVDRANASAAPVLPPLRLHAKPDALRAAQDRARARAQSGGVPMPAMKASDLLLARASKLQRESFLIECEIELIEIRLRERPGVDEHF